MDKWDVIERLARAVEMLSARVTALERREIGASGGGGGGVPPSRQIVAGAGLTGGGNLASDVTIHVGAGDGIAVDADTVRVDSSVVRTARAINTSNPLTGGGDLSANRTLALKYDSTLRISDPVTGTLGVRARSGFGNRLQVLPTEGVYVPPETIDGGADSQSIYHELVAGPPFSPGKLRYHLRIHPGGGLTLMPSGVGIARSPDAGNVLELRSNGLYVGSAPAGTFVQTGSLVVTLTQVVGDYRVQYMEITHSLVNPRCLAIAEGAPVCIAVDRYETNKVVLIAFADTKLTGVQQCTVRWWLIA